MTTSTTDAEAIARETWLAIEAYLDGECNLGSCGDLSDADRANCENFITNAILSFLASRREAQEPVAPFADNGYGSRLLREAVAYLNEYVFDFDSGSDHEPTEFERFMMEDMLNGLFSHEPFFGIIRNLAAPPAPAGEVERLRGALEIAREVHFKAASIASGLPKEDPEHLRWLHHSYGADEVAYKIDAALNGGRE